MKTSKSRKFFKTNMAHKKDSELGTYASANHLPDAVKTAKMRVAQHHNNFVDKYGSNKMVAKKYNPYMQLAPTTVKIDDPYSMSNAS